MDLDAELGGFIRDCRTCRDAEGRCTIDDGYEDVLLNRALPADAWVFATPLYWYSVSAQLKAFLDRISCYIADSYPDSGDVIAALKGKRYGAVVSSEETYSGAALALVHQLQEFTRYVRGELVGIVRGIGNQRGDVLHDPAEPPRRRARPRRPAVRDPSLRLSRRQRPRRIRLGSLTGCHRSQRAECAFVTARSRSFAPR